MRRLFALLLGLETLILLIGVLGMTWLQAPLAQALNPARDLSAFFVLYWTLVGLEALIPCLFSEATKHLEHLFSGLGQALKATPHPEQLALVLAAASALGEEVFFRGFLQSLLTHGLGAAWAVALQALIFTLFHPIPDRRAWIYPFFVLLAGLLLGLAYLATGSLLPGLLAHFLYNLKGFFEALEEGKTPPRRGYA